MRRLPLDAAGSSGINGGACDLTEGVSVLRSLCTCMSLQLWCFGGSLSVSWIMRFQDLWRLLVLYDFYETLICFYSSSGCSIRQNGLVVQYHAADLIAYILILWLAVLLSIRQVLGWGSIGTIGDGRWFGHNLYCPVNQIYCDIVRICRNYIRIDIRVDMRSGIRTDIRSENILVGL
jgi:hypothetical protein